MAETPEHQRLVAGLVGYMKGQGVEVTNAAGGLNYPDPYAVGAHEPDALGTKGGVLLIGEAKIGSDLTSATSQEQFRDFSNRSMTGTGAPCPFILCVPKGWADAARQAVKTAGGSTRNLTVIS